MIGFTLPGAGEATLTIQDVTGRTLRVVRGQFAQGYNQVNVKASDLNATGVLSYTLKAGEYTATKKMIILE
ncbi:MAG: T9SS type A sorting domain-containing protein [Haliscomenobacter sp.]|nr:T9SS type A sorting domain-containing protein [Haliscomenobacter sp.]